MIERSFGRKTAMGTTAKLFAGALALGASVEACAPAAASPIGHTLDAVVAHTTPETERSFDLSEMAIVLHPPEAARGLIEVERALPPDAYAAREAISGMIGLDDYVKASVASDKATEKMRAYLSL